MRKATTFLIYFFRTDFNVVVELSIWSFIQLISPFDHSLDMMRIRFLSLARRKISLTPFGKSCNDLFHSFARIIMIIAIVTDISTRTIIIRMWTAIW